MGLEIGIGWLTFFMFGTLIFLLLLGLPLAAGRLKTGLALAPERQRAEWRVRVVELKWVCEMLAHIRSETVDYYHPEVWEVYRASMPPDPTDMDGLLVGAWPDDPTLARQLLAFPAKGGDTK